MKYLFALGIMLFSIAVFAQQKPEGLFINSKAPEINAPDQSGIQISLKELRKKGPVVILFYQGYWSPTDIKMLKRFQDSLQFFTDKNARIVGITPESSESIQQTLEKSGALFSIISDADGTLAKAYGVSYAIDEKSIGRYKNAGVDLAAINNQKNISLPIPAAYVVNRDGTITARFFNPDIKKRASVNDLLAEIK